MKPFQAPQLRRWRHSLLSLCCATCCENPVRVRRGWRLSSAERWRNASAKEVSTTLATFSLSLLSARSKQDWPLLLQGGIFDFLLDSLSFPAESGWRRDVRHSSPAFYPDPFLSNSLTLSPASFLIPSATHSLTLNTFLCPLHEQSAFPSPLCRELCSLLFSSLLSTVPPCRIQILEQQ